MRLAEEKQPQIWFAVKVKCPGEDFPNDIIKYDNGIPACRQAGRDPDR